MIEIVTIATPSLGDRSYLATDGFTALVVDPQRDIDQVLAVAATRGVVVTHVLDTHIHNDYLSGGWALARVVGADYCLNAADEVAFERVGVSDDDFSHAAQAGLTVTTASPVSASTAAS